MTSPLPGHEWREALAAYVRMQAIPVEKFGHQPRLYALTRAIGLGLVFDDDVVYAAAWLHDLGVFVGHRPEDPALLAVWDSVGYAIDQAPGILRRVGFPTEKLDSVLECIRNHQPDSNPSTLESTLLRDADMLEQLGAVAILRTVCKVGRDTRFQNFTQAIAALTTALQTLPSLLRLPASRELAAGRIGLHRDFLTAVQAEAGNLLL